MEGNMEAVSDAVQAAQIVLRELAAGAVTTSQRAEIFNDFDMVVAVSQQTINEQLKKLVEQGVIKSELLLAQTLAGQDYVYKLLDSPAELPPNSAYIIAKVQPRIVIPASGAALTLVLDFVSGKGGFWIGGAGPLATLSEFDMAGWSYGFTVTLDLAAVAADDIASGRAVSDAIRKQLSEFQSQMFSISRLFLDFVSSDLLRFDPQTTSAGPQNAASKELAAFMQFYFKGIDHAANPFVLGYCVTAGDGTEEKGDQANVPDLLKPVGTAFTLYRDAEDANRSTLNFALVTKGGHGRVPGSPPNMTASWLPPGAAAAVAYSHACLVEPMLLQPVFQQIRESVYAGISGNLSVGEGNDYAAARTKTANGWTFSISNVNGGDDQYCNSFNVAVSQAPDSLRLDFRGTVSVHKEVSKNCFFCTARGWATCTLAWSGTIDLAVVDGALKVGGSGFKTDSSNNDHGTNTCADAFDWIGKIVGGILDVFTGFSDNFFFSKLISDAFSVRTPGIGVVSVALGALADSARSTIVLPAGDQFKFGNPPLADDVGDLIIPLAYQTGR
jgi:hypothetical protein